MIDLGFVGQRFTWCHHQVHERIDRALANEAWRLVSTDILVAHLPRVASDHSPLLIRIKPVDAGLPVQKKFKYLAAWESHQDWQQWLRDKWCDSLALPGAQ
ncbi:OLC1v1013018C1 [Oldenlandia corymbosa var. corymbosa]|uniref:OLC1v1013018C1 n=1 Tax=Oldenlandia corymbosa var. corymbosa TaxID=529605 RepID=A0AAV1DX84_OLDCO|nr:OLC1v1013018C1 [Oldenlandia corymbosa var. corymbosa]